MSVVTRQAARAIASAPTPLQRTFATSAIQLAPGKGKAAKPAAPKKKAQQGFSKQRSSPAKAGGSGGSSNSTSITLRYENSRPAPDLSDFTVLQPEAILERNVGAPTTLPTEVIEKLRVFGLPRRLDKEFARGQAVTVIRDSTVQLANRLKDVQAGKTDKQATILTGDRGSGKSTLLLQTVAQALSSGWIVLYVPRASEWITSTTSYAYSPSSQRFDQPALSSTLLDKLIKANSASLEGLKTKAEITLSSGSSVSAGESILDLARRGTGVDGAKDAVEVLKAVVGELSAQKEVPFLFAIDEVEALFSRSQYLTPQGGHVESYHLSAPALALEYISGLKTVDNGLLLTALSYSTPFLPPTLTALHALGLSQTSATSPITPYTPLESTHHANAAPLAKGKIDVPPLSPKEAAGVFEGLSKMGKVMGQAGDETFLSALASGSGNPLVFSRSVTQMLRA